MKKTTNFTKLQKKENINYFLYALAFYAVTVAYAIPFKTTFPYARIFLPLLVIILTSQLVNQKLKIKKTDIIALCTLIISSLLNFNQIIMFKFILPISLILVGFQSNKQIKLARNYLVFLYWYSVPFILYQLCVYRDSKDTASSEGGRIVLSSGDSNMSGLFMLLFFFFCWKNKFKFGILLSITCLGLFISRNYLFSMIIFFILGLLENKLYKFFQRLNFPLIFILANFTILLLSKYWISSVEVSTVYDTSSARLFNVNDLSNFQRFQANVFLLDSFTSNFNLAFSGFKEDYITAFKNTGFGIIHNSFLQIIAVLGIVLGALYFYVVLSKIQKYYCKENFKYIYSYLFFCLFLHSSLEGALLQLLLVVLAIPEVNSVNKNLKLAKNNQNLLVQNLEALYR